MIFKFLASMFNIYCEIAELDFKCFLKNDIILLFFIFWKIFSHNFLNGWNSEVVKSRILIWEKCFFLCRVGDLYILLKHSGSEISELIPLGFQILNLSHIFTFNYRNSSENDLFKYMQTVLFKIYYLNLVMEKRVMCLIPG